MRLKKCMITMTAMVSTCSVLVLGGCSSKTDTTSAKQTAVAAANTTEPSASAAEAASATPEATTQATPEATAAQDATASPAAEGTDTYKPGTLTTSEYKNEFIGLEFKATKDYSLATRAQMEQVFGAGAKIMYGDKSDEVVKISKETVAYEMMAVAKTGEANVNICVQEEPIANMTEQDYMDAFKTQLSTMQTVKAQLGTAKDVDFCSEKYLLTPISMEMNGVALEERVYLRKKGKTFILVTVSGKKGADKAVDALLANFKSTK